MTTITRTSGIRIRQSSLEDARCLYRFNKHHIEGVPQPESEAAVRGSEIHELHAQYLAHLVVTSQQSDYDFADKIAEQYPGDPSQLFRDWVRNRFFEPEKVYALEFPILLDWDLQPAAPDATVDEAPFGGIIDRLEIDGTAGHIIDLKSHWAVFSPTTLQSIFYPWLLRKLMPSLESIKFTLDFVRWGVTREREFTAQEIDDLEPQILAQVKRLALAQNIDVWPATPNAKCAYCVLDCPLVHAGADPWAIGQIKSPAIAVEMAQELFAIQARASKLRAALKSYAGEMGPVRMPNNLEFGFVKRESFEYPARQVLGLNNQYGFADTRALKVDNREIKKIGRQYPDYLEKLAKHGKDKSSTPPRFISTDPQEPLPVEEDEEWS